MPLKNNSAICKDHSSVITRLEHLEAQVDKNEGRLDDGQKKFADFSSDMRVIKLGLGVLMLLVLGGTLGPKVWALLF
jgi:uncharacterized membrane-anchored protein